MHKRLSSPLITAQIQGQDGGDSSTLFLIGSIFLLKFPGWLDVIIILNIYLD